MDEAITRIISAAPIHAPPLGFPPSRGWTDIVDPEHLVRSPA